MTDMSALDPDVFLDSLELAKTLPCLAEPGRIIVIGTPTPPLDEVLPLIAAISPSLIAFNPRTPSVTLRRKPGFITFYRDQVIVTQVKDVSEGLEMISALRDLVNLCWKQRATVKPATEARQAPRPLDVWTLLPRTNVGWRQGPARPCRRGRRASSAARPGPGRARCRCRGVAGGGCVPPRPSTWCSPGSRHLRRLGMQRPCRPLAWQTCALYPHLPVSDCRCWDSNPDLCRF